MYVFRMQFLVCWFWLMQFYCLHVYWLHMGSLYHSKLQLTKFRDWSNDLYFLSFWEYCHGRMLLNWAHDGPPPPRIWGTSTSSDWRWRPDANNLAPAMSNIHMPFSRTVGLPGLPTQRPWEEDTKVENLLSGMMTSTTPSFTKVGEISSPTPGQYGQAYLF